MANNWRVVTKTRMRKLDTCTVLCMYIIIQRKMVQSRKVEELARI